VRRVGAATAPRAIRSIGLTLVQESFLRAPVTGSLTVTFWLKLSVQTL